MKKVGVESPTEAEQRVLDVVLCEMRHAMATKEQLTILIDPFLFSDDGVDLHVHYSAAGLSQRVEGKMRAKKKTIRRKR